MYSPEVSTHSFKLYFHCALWGRLDSSAKAFYTKLIFPKYAEQKLELPGEAPKREYFLESLITAVPIVFNF